MLVIDIGYELDLLSHGVVDMEREVINIESPSLVKALEATMLDHITSLTIPLDSPFALIAETDDPFANHDFLGHMRCFEAQLTPQEMEWVCKW